MIKFMKSKAQDINKHHRKVFIFFFGCRKLYLYIYIYIEIKDIIKKKFKSTYLFFSFLFSFFLGVTILWFNGIWKNKNKKCKNTFFDYVFYFITIQILRIIDKERKKNNNNPLSILFFSPDWLDEYLNYNILSN